MSKSRRANGKPAVSTASALCRFNPLFFAQCRSLALLHRYFQSISIGAMISLAGKSCRVHEILAIGCNDTKPFPDDNDTFLTNDRSTPPVLPNPDSHFNMASQVCNLSAVMSQFLVKYSAASVPFGCVIKLKKLAACASELCRICCSHDHKQYGYENIFIMFPVKQGK